MFVRVCVSPPRLLIGTGRRCCIAHWSNIQLTRVELSIPDAAIEIASEKVTASTLPHLGFGARGVWKRRGRKIVGRDEPRGLHWTRRQQNYNTGQPIGRVEDAQAQDKLSRRVRKTKTEEQRDAQWKSAEESPLGEVADRLEWPAEVESELWRLRAGNASWVSQHPIGMQQK